MGKCHSFRKMSNFEEKDNLEKKNLSISPVVVLTVVSRQFIKWVYDLCLVTSLISDHKACVQSGVTSTEPYHRYRIYLQIDNKYPSEAVQHKSNLLKRD